MPPRPASVHTWHISGDDPGAWPTIFGSIGLPQASGGPVKVAVIRQGAVALAPLWIPRIEDGIIITLEGDSELARAFGFVPTEKRIVVRGAVDERRPNLAIYWEQPLDLNVFEIPKDARVFARERWNSAPLVAGVRRGKGAILWMATGPGTRGYERYPYLLQALVDLGLEPPFRSSRLWAFFDSSYRSRIDVDYFAERWRKSGIAALHVAAWHYYESGAASDEYLRKLIEACHRRGILVYAWIELPHVSEKFWQDHPEWREKTALLQDAHLDWRKLMNLRNRDCFAAVAKGTRDLVERFDWDGVNLGELYFESLEGAANPARFTPMNEEIRREFQELHGKDPRTLFTSPEDAAGMREFLDYRANLTHRMQEQWIGELERIRGRRPSLDLVLTHVDDRFDTRMRDLIGADAARLLPALSRHDFTFLIEDPATVWHLGPERYPEIAKRYEPLTPHQRKLAIDINIVERYQDVYPTKQQTGTELFQLVHLASRAFERVALYFENSILTPDLPLLGSSASGVAKVESLAGKLVVESRHGVGVPWQGPAKVNGRTWPVTDGQTLWLPPGRVVAEASGDKPFTRILDFNGNLKSASPTSDGVEFAYESSSRALAIIDRAPVSVEVDGTQVQPEVLSSGNTHTLVLPRGQHLISVRTRSLRSAGD
jgi:hypothetical protein